MISTKIVDMKIKKLFFDEPKVINAVSKARLRYLRNAGGYARKVAKSLIKNPGKRKRAAHKKDGGVGSPSSAPGSPPFSHTGVLRGFIFFAYDQSRDSVVVGPAKTNQVFFDRNRKPVRGTVPEVLEEGGTIRILEVLKNGKWRRADLRSRRRLAGRRTRYRAVKIKPRPYMDPALKATIPKLPEMWRNSVRST